MRRTDLKLAFAFVAFAFAAAPLARAAAAAERTLEFSGGYVFSGLAQTGFEVSPGLDMQARYFLGRTFFVSGHLSGDLLIDMNDPERAEAVPALGLGLGAGVRLELPWRFSAYGGGQAEWVNLWNWPRAGAPRHAVHDGLRLAPTAGLALRLGRLWRHAMAIEARMLAGGSRIDGRWHRTLRGGLSLTGVLLPEPTQSHGR